MFPDTNTNWQAFFEVQKLILKNAGKVYAPSPYPSGLHQGDLSLSSALAVRAPVCTALLPEALCHPRVHVASCERDKCQYPHGTELDEHFLAGVFERAGYCILPCALCPLVRTREGCVLAHTGWLTS